MQNYKELNAGKLTSSSELSKIQVSIRGLQDQQCWVRCFQCYQWHQTKFKKVASCSVGLYRITKNFSHIRQFFFFASCSVGKYRITTDLWNTQKLGSNLALLSYRWWWLIPYKCVLFCCVLLRLPGPGCQTWLSLFAWAYYSRTVT